MLAVWQKFIQYTQANPHLSLLISYSPFHQQSVSFLAEVGREGGGERPPEISGSTVDRHRRAHILSRERHTLPTSRWIAGSSQDTKATVLRADRVFAPDYYAPERFRHPRLKCPPRVLDRCQILAPNTWGDRQGSLPESEGLYHTP